jgi:hypothetical protein
MKITPALASSSLKVVTTDTESNTASTATLRSFAHAGQDFLFGERNAELLIGAQQFRIDIVDRLRPSVAFGAA